MAKSFHTILGEGTLEVDHRGETVTLELPGWLAEAKDVLLDEAKLKAWAEENEILHGLLHAGIQKTLIDMRAKARPGTNAKTGETKSIIDDKAAAQARLNDFVVKPTLPPGHSTNPLKKAVQALKALGMDLKTIQGVLTDKFDSAEIEAMFNSL